MSDDFPDKKAGDPFPGARHINNINRACRIVVGAGGGSYSHSHNGNTAGVVPFVQRTMIITKVFEDDDEISSVSSANEDESCPGAKYLAKYRYYDEDDAEWKTDEDSGAYCLDSSEYGNALALNDIVTAFWDPVRGMFVGGVGIKIDIVELIDDLHDCGNPATGWLLDNDFERKGWNLSDISSGDQVEVDPKFFIGYKFGLQDGADITENRGEFVATITVNGTRYAISAGHQVLIGGSTSPGQELIFAGQIGHLYGFGVFSGTCQLMTIPRIRVYALTDYIPINQVVLSWFGGYWYLVAPDCHTLLGRADENIAQGAYGQFSIYIENPGETDSGYNVQAKCRAAAMTLNDYAYISRVNNHHEAVPAVC